MHHRVHLWGSHAALSCLGPILSYFEVVYSVKCPHCLENFHEQFRKADLGEDPDGTWIVSWDDCPSCNRLIINLQRWKVHGYLVSGDGSREPNDIKEEERLIRPRSSSRGPAPSTVPRAIAGDYQEACIVLPDSPKASAALSRRCLQNLLRDAGGVKPGNLADEIAQVLKSSGFPSYLAEQVDAIRHTGNFAAHPEKSNNTGEIVDVEPGEAEWNLDVLELLFDFYYVQPALAQQKRAALNKKLGETGKKPMR
jgi:hypothetical protein